MKVQLLAIDAGQFVGKVQQCDFGAFLFCREGERLLGTEGYTKQKEGKGQQYGGQLVLDMVCCTLSVLHLKCFIH